MDNREFAIVDIETTGGNASGSRITEIAILIHDGQKVIERWETLVNPEREIPLPIFALTGITNEMVARAPVFGDIAGKVYDMLTGRIFIAHSVNFDYSFVRHQLAEAGFTWTAKKLCTVRASRRIIPGLPSYGLGRLCENLGIGIVNRHRAGGDADATAVLFTKLLQADGSGEIEKMLSKGAQDYRLPPNLPHGQFDDLPEKPGIYYFYNQVGKVVYVGKALNIKKRVASHFTGHNISPQRQNFIRDVHAVSAEVCATELMSLILECNEIQKLWPAYNRALKRFEPKFGLFEYEARSGHRYLAVGRLRKHQPCHLPYNTLYEAVADLRSVAATFGIDPRFCHFGTTDAGDFVRQPATPLPPADRHNRHVQLAIESLLGERQTFAILDRGRNAEERSCLYIENGTLHSMGYLPADASFTRISDLPDYLTRCRSNQYIMQLVTTFAGKNPGKVFRETFAVTPGFAAGIT